MNRVIKFCGKRVDNGEWVYGYWVSNGMHSYIFSGKLNITGLYPTLEKRKVIPETVGQFTGLHDKNGIEIYEGDIVNCDFEDRGRGAIGFALNNQQTMIFKYKGGYYGEPICDLDYFTVRFCEVIGNIHDNPELLEVPK